MAADRPARVTMNAPFHDARQQARAARGELEDVLGVRVRDWMWSSSVSRWIDCLVLLSETTAS